MKILFVCSTDPRETAYGGQQRTHVLWKGLRSIPGAEVTTLVSVPHKKLERSNNELRIYHKCYERRYSIGWVVQRVLKRAFPWWDVSCAYDLKRLYQDFGGTDVVISRYLRPAAEYRLWHLASLVVDVDDTPTAEFDIQTTERNNTIWRRLRRYCLGRWQDNVCRHAKLLWVPDPMHVALFGRNKAVHLPNLPLVEAQNNAREVEREPLGLVIGFVGYLAHPPNYFALDWFLTSFWKTVQERFPGITFRIAGGGLPEKYRNSWKDLSGVELLGFVKDLKAFYNSINVVLTPMQIGSGTCIKVLEAMQFALPILSTDQGLRGIPFADRTLDNGILIFSENQSLVDALEGLMDSSTRRRAGRAAYNYVCREYSMAKFFGIVEKGLSSI